MVTHEFALIMNVSQNVLIMSFSVQEKSGLASALELSIVLKERSSECRREFFARPEWPPPTTINFVIPPEGDSVDVHDKEEDVPNEVGHLLG